MIVNTRPIELGEKTNFLLQKSKCAYIHLPLTRIIKTEPSAKALQNINSLDDYDLLIFTSQSAVIYSAKYWKEFLLNIRAIPILAIGLATQESLQRFNLPSSIPPTFNSEGLACIIEEKDYKKCLVFCGEKSPRILDLTVTEIDTFPCYASNDEENINLSGIKNENKLVVLIYTQQSLEVLMRELPFNKSQKIILIVASKRLEKLSIKYGFRESVLAESPHDEDMVHAALVEA